MIMGVCSFPVLMIAFLQGEKAMNKVNAEELLPSNPSGLPPPSAREAFALPQCFRKT
jgi:hypothetical protein